MIFFTHLQTNRAPCIDYRHDENQQTHVKAPLEIIVVVMIDVIYSMVSILSRRTTFVIVSNPYFILCDVFEIVSNP